MNKNFTIKDGVVFNVNDKDIDFRRKCELASVKYLAGTSPSVEIEWRKVGSNRIIIMHFSEVECFIVRNRDQAYPKNSGTFLNIAGFTRQDVDLDSGEFYTEPEEGIECLSFVMADMSAFIVEAQSVNLQRI